MRKKIVSILGGNSNVSSDALQLSEDLGKAIVDQGWLLCTGGRSGVMEAASKGGQKSDLWTGHQILGVLPEEEHVHGNPYLDVVLPTGIGLTRNALVVRFSDVCIAVSGGAGTLSEIALAWQFQRPIALMKYSGGWPSKLAETALDHRKDPIRGLDSVEDALQWISEMLGDSP